MLTFTTPLHFPNPNCRNLLCIVVVFFAMRLPPPPFPLAELNSQPRAFSVAHLPWRRVRSQCVVDVAVPFVHRPHHCAWRCSRRHGVPSHARRFRSHRRHTLTCLCRDTCRTCPQRTAASHRGQVQRVAADGWEGRWWTRARRCRGGCGNSVHLASTRR